MKKLKLIFKNHNRTIFITLIAFLYTALLICLSFYHENWRDEAQAWLICRDLSFIGMIKQITLEGHPILWYLILFTLTKLGLPYHTMNIVSCLLIGASIFLLLKNAPFPMLVKILIMLSIPFLYQHSIIARNYSLIPLIIVLLAINYSQKIDHPYRYAILLILLMNTHSLMLGLTILLLFEWILECLKFNKKEKNYHLIFSILLVTFILGITFCFYIYSYISTSYVNHSILQKLSLTKIIKTSLEYFHYFSNGHISIWYKSPTSIIILGSVILISVIMLICNRKLAIIYLGSIIFEWAIFYFVLQASPHRIMTITYIVLFCSWLLQDTIQKRKIKWLLNCSLIIFFGCLSYLSFSPIKDDIIKNYSSSKEMGQYLNIILNIDDELIGIYDAKISSILPYLDNKKVWSPITKEYFSFVTWNNQREQILSANEILSNIKQKFSNNQTLLYIYAAGENEDFKNMMLQNKKLNLLYKTKSSLCGEYYELYELII